MHWGRLLASVSVAFLGSCGQAGGNDAAANNQSASATADPAAPATSPPGPDADLPRELAMTAQMLNKQMPLRQETAQGMVTVTGIEARGTEMIHRVTVPADLDAGTFEQFKAQLPARLCEDNQLRQLLLRGGSQTYVMRDRDGEEFTATVDRC